MKRAIFFDLDGTLWDGIEPICKSWNKAMIDRNLKYRFTLADIKGHMGLTPLETVHIAFNDVPEDEGLQCFKYCLLEEVKYMATHPGKMYPDEVEVIAELAKKYSLYVISNCDSGYIENYLNALDMKKYFTSHTCIGDTGFPKWKNIVTMKLNEGIDQVIYVGDTLKDKVESQTAGVAFIHAKYGFGEITEDEYYVSNLRELPAKIEEVFNNYPKN